MDSGEGFSNLPSFGESGFEDGEKPGGASNAGVPSGKRPLAFAFAS